MSWGRFRDALASSFMLWLVSSVSAAEAAGPLDAGRTLADSGKHGAAISAYSKILNSGSLSPADTARGFYLRGVSYTKSGRNPQAISDLTNALWLTGLSKQERANAFRMRAVAYKASGYAKKAEADLKRAGGKTGRVEPPAAVGLTTPIAPAKKVASNTTGAQAWTSETQSGGASGWTATASAPQSKATPKTAAAPSQNGNAVSNFFSGIFGGGNSAPPPKPAPVKKQKVASLPQASDGSAAVSSWSSSVSASKQTAPKKQTVSTNWNTNTAATQVVKKKPVAVKKVAKKAKPKKGRYNVQVATVRERAEAELILRSLSQKAPKKLEGLRPSIDTAVLGNMGTFYRVRVDGLATRQASANLCKVLMQSGHDCFLIGP